MAGKKRREKERKGAESACCDRFKHLRDKGNLSRKWASLDEEGISPGFECLWYPHASVASPPSCARTCVACFAQDHPLHWQQDFGVLRYTKKHNDTAAAEAINNLTSETRGNLAAPHGELQDHGNAIMKRWLKRDPARRRALVLEAMPNMLRERIDGPEWEKLCCEPLANYREGLLLPWLNAAKLSEEPMNLFALLHHRTNTHPSEWVIHDSEHLKAFFIQGALEVEYNACCVKMYGDYTTFGRLVHWQKDAAHRWEMIGLPRAKLILDAQKTLSCFLLKIVKLLLQNDKPTGADKWNELVAADFREEDSARKTKGPNFRTMSFRAAPRLSLDRMIDSFQTRYYAAKDEAWLVQTDPAFAKQLLATMQASDCLTLTDENTRRRRLIALLFACITGPGQWRAVRDEARLARGNCNLHGYNFTMGQEIPRDCAHSLRVLEYALISNFGRLISQIRMFSMQFGLLDDTFAFRKKGILSMQKNAEKGTLFRCLDGLSRHDLEDGRDPGYILETLEHESRTAAGNRMTQHMIDVFSNMYTVDEAIMALRYSRPSTAPMMFWQEFQDSRHDREWWDDDKWRTEIAKDWPDYLDTLWPKLEKLLNTPLPTEKLSWKTLEHFDTSYEALSDFWTTAIQVREAILKKHECPLESQVSVMTELSDSQSEKYHTERTAERELLVQEIEKKEAEVEARNNRIAALKENASKARPTTPAQQVWGSEDSTPTFSRIRLNKDDIRRSSALEEDVNTNNNANVQDVVEDLQQITLDSKDPIEVSSGTMEIFTRMFVSWGKRSHGNVRWQDFVAAMADAGAIASQAAGSALTFRFENKSIVLHQPHPDHTIHPIMLRSFGKRLYRSFGWEIEQFVERE